MIVFCVEYVCADSHYGYNLECIFSTLEKAEAYVFFQKSYVRSKYRIVEHAVDSWEIVPEVTR